MKEPRTRTGKDREGTGGIIARLDTSLPLRLLGFGLIYAWSTCLWDIPLMGNGSLDVLQGRNGWVLSATLTPITCLVIALAGRTRTFSGCRGLRIAGPGLCTLGTVAAIASEYAAKAGNFALVLIAGIGTGCGPALLILEWTVLVAELDIGLVETIVPASFVATLLCALIIPSLPVPLGLAILTLLPLASGALYALSQYAFDTGHLPAQDPPTNAMPFAISLKGFARMLAIVFVIYVLACIAGAAAIHPLSAAAEAYTTVAGMLFAIALSVSLVLFSRRINITSLYRWITVPFVASVVASVIDGETTSLLARVLMNVVFTGIEIIIVLYVVRLTQRTRRPAAFFIGWGECAAYTGVLLGYLLQPLVRSELVAPTDNLFACVVVLGVFSLASLLVPSDEAMLLEQSPPCGTLPDRSDAQSDGTHAGRLMRATSEPSSPETNTGSDTPAPVATSYGAELDAILAHRTTVAQSYGLSSRETEIFLLLAQGRSRPYIRDSLYLSKNTVATHIRHIYEKLGVHSQQELIDLAER